ncbi:SMI1/KNR4 family protein [Bartonella grahamii]|uniref:SMI1/KNR4 family protein n=1 Tax=Bartonella grahamii TaxID=33045 RepID=UPI002E7C0D80|nr:SMI1/KNR4 family protein [Bartonella grahamii]
MKTYTLDDVVQLIDKVNKYDDEIINFGTAEDAVSDVRIKEAEKTLGLQFTASYKDFLKNYKGGEIGYEEIFSIYNASFEDHPAGDIVHKNLYHRKHGFATLEQLVVSRTDFGETFYFDYTQFQDGECPLYFEVISGDPLYYASNFYEFLCKRITDNLK